MQDAVGFRIGLNPNQDIRSITLVFIVFLAVMGALWVVALNTGGFSACAQGLMDALKGSGLLKVCAGVLVIGAGFLVSVLARKKYGKRGAPPDDLTP